MLTYFLGAAALLTMGYFMGRAHGRILERFDMAIDETVEATDKEKSDTVLLTPSRN